MAAFDPLRDERQIKRMKLDEVIDELRERKEDETGTDARLRSRLLDARARGAAAMDVDDDSAERKDPRVWSREDVMIFERDVNRPDEDWVTNIHPQRVNGAKIKVASTRGMRAPGGGTKMGIPVAEAAYWSRVLALSKVPLWKTDVWNSAAAEPYKVDALYILDKPAPIVEHGCNKRDARNTWLMRRTDGRVVAYKFASVDGRQVIHKATVDTRGIEKLRKAEQAGQLPPGTATFASAFASDFLEDPAAARAKRRGLLEVEEAAIVEEAEGINAMDLKCQAESLRALDAALVRGSGSAHLLELNDDGSLPIENRSALHLVKNPVAVAAWRGHGGCGGRGSKDENLKHIKDALKPPKWEKRGETTEMHNIIVAAMPYLKRKRFRCLLDYLVSKAQIDHIFSGVTDHPSNLIVEFAGPNNHFSDHRNCPGKAARYGADIMQIAADWIRQAIAAALGVVSYSTESA